MLIGAEYNDEMRSQMAIFLVSLQFIIKTFIAHHNNLFNLCIAAQAFTRLQFVTLHSAAGRVL